MIYCWRMTFSFPKLDDIFDRISAVDCEIVNVIGNNEKVGKLERIQFCFEFYCVAPATICFIINCVYDIWMFYPP